MTFLRLVVLVLSLISAAPNPEAKCGSDPGCFSGQGDACFSDHHIHGNYIRPPRCLVGNKAEDYKQGCQALDCAPNRTCHWTNDTISPKSGIQNVRCVYQTEVKDDKAKCLLHLPAMHC